LRFFVLTLVLILAACSGTAAPSTSPGAALASATPVATAAPTPSPSPAPAYPASLTDDETRDRLRDEQMSHLQSWIDAYQEHRTELGIDDSVDIREAVLYSWAAEVGLGVMEAVGIEPRTKKGWADMAARFGRSLTLPAQPSPSSRTR
jgi:hypothetical protein